LNIQPKQKFPLVGKYAYESLAHRTVRQHAERAAIMAALRAGATSREALEAVDGQGGMTDVEDAEVPQEGEQQ
jgi:hypothetical protein